MRLLVVQLGADVNARNRFHHPGLTEVVMRADVEMMRTMLEVGADPNVGDGWCTPLAMSTTSTLPAFKLIKSFGHDPGPHKSGFDCAVGHACANSNCRKAGAKSTCSRCKSVWYCSRECQRESWGQHKLVCKKSQANE